MLLKVQFVEEFSKDSHLMDIMNEYLQEEGDESTSLMLIFVKMKRTAWRLEKKLKAHNYLLTTIHGDKSQKVGTVPPCPSLLRC